jgi:hypothetical protein
VEKEEVEEEMAGFAWLKRAAVVVGRRHDVRAAKALARATRARAADMVGGSRVERRESTGVAWEGRRSAFWQSSSKARLDGLCSQDADR